MKIKLAEPFASQYRMGFLGKEQNGRRRLWLYNSKKERANVLWDRYLLSVKEGRILSVKEFHEIMRKERISSGLDKYHYRNNKCHR